MLRTRLVKGIPMAAQQLERAIENIDRIIQQVAEENGAQVVRDARSHLATSSRCSYVLVDRYGVLVIDVELWPGARIRGGSRSGEWVARAGRTSRRRFPNPLAENARRLESVKSALMVFGKRLGSEYFSDLVVLDAEDISALTLRERHRPRVTSTADLERVLRARYDFAVNGGALRSEEVEEIGRLLRRASGAEEVTPDEASSARQPASPLAPRVPDVAASPGVAAASSPAPAVSSPVPWAATVAPAPWSVVAASPSAPLFAPPVAPHVAASTHAFSRYPEVTPTRVRTPSVKSVFMLIALSAIVVWLTLYGGYARVTDLVKDQLGALSPTSEHGFNTGLAGADLRRAKEVFHAQAPEIYEAAEDLNFPEVVLRDEEVTYTWHYRDTAGERREYSVVLDLSGDFKRVSYR